ncbi:hypothetical protein A5906_09600 [Bradyrhizobium sacchari]|nr:hypothetical protein A5906_09600 [Bradyrhizobium sacchari]
MSPAARAKLKELIGATYLAAISSWVDDYKFTPEGKSTYRWHFVDIDIERSTYDAALDCKDINNQGTCIVQGFPAAIAILKDESSSKGDRLRALRLVVHLVGDLEQPLHASERNGDQGGNKLHVVLHAKRSDGTAYTKTSTFHSMWDDSLVDLQAYSWRSYADALDANPLPVVEMPPYDEARIGAWANDTHALGIKAYQLLPPGTPDHTDTSHPVDINNDYAIAIKPDLGRELAKGAARLKAILDDALGGS